MNIEFVNEHLPICVLHINSWSYLHSFVWRYRTVVSSGLVQFWYLIEVHLRICWPIFIQLIRVMSHILPSSYRIGAMEMEIVQYIERKNDTCNNITVLFFNMLRLTISSFILIKKKKTTNSSHCLSHLINISVEFINFTEQSKIIKTILK